MFGGIASVQLDYETLSGEIISTVPNPIRERIILQENVKIRTYEQNVTLLVFKAFGVRILNEPCATLFGNYPYKKTL